MLFWNKQNETPLTQAVISNDLGIVRKFSINESYKSARNYLGFNAADLARYLGNKEMLECFFSPLLRKFKVVKPGEDLITEMGIPEYESFFRARYINSIKFCSYQEFCSVIKLCPKGIKSGSLGSEMRQFFELNRDKIETGYVVDFSIKWIDKYLGYGLFAEKPIKEGEFIGEYCGVVQRSGFFQAGKSCEYAMRYPKLSFGFKRYMYDAGKWGNELRFANHSYSPNLQPVIALENGLCHPVLIALKDIESGEQLVYDYGEDYWSKRHPPQDI